MEMIGCRSKKPRVADTMEEAGDNRRSSSQLIRKQPESLEDVPEELMHLIQSYILDPKEAARTCILSKSWLHAWSTIPTLRFREQLWSVKPTQQANQVMMIDRTLQRYLRDNIPFETIDLAIDINDQVSDSLAERWIRPVATRTCVKELSLDVNVNANKVRYTMPGEIFSSENIRKIRIASGIKYICICSNPVIKCVSLRVLELINVHISEEVLDNLLSTCSLIKELKLSRCEGLKTIKVKNLRYLCKLRIVTPQYEDNLEIHDVPNLSCLKYHSLSQKYFHAFAKDSLGGSVTELSLQGVIIDEAFLDMIKLKFRLLQNLTLDQIQGWSSESSFDITCLSLKTLSLCFNDSSPIPVKVQVFAPKLGCFKYYAGKTMMPSRLIFPAGITPEQIHVGLVDMDHPMDGLFFVKLREALMLPSNFDIHILSTFRVAAPLNIDLDDLRRRFPFPATNLQHLSVETTPRNRLFPEYSPSVDALFLICHPKYVSARKGFEGNHYICNKLMMMIKESSKGSWADDDDDYLEGVEIKNPDNGNWETLTDSSKTRIIRPTSLYQRLKFKLNWCRRRVS